MAFRSTNTWLVATSRWNAGSNRPAKALLDSDIDIEPSNEYASDIMNSMSTGNPSVIYGNVKNNGLIPSLPEACVVEVPCLVDRNGILTDTCWFNAASADRDYPDKL